MTAERVASDMYASATNRQHDDLSCTEVGSSCVPRRPTSTSNFTDFVDRIAKRKFMLKRDRGEDSTDAHPPSMWPYGHGGALLAAPLCWLIFALIFLATHRYLQWPNAELGK